MQALSCYKRFGISRNKDSCILESLAYQEWMASAIFPYAAHKVLLQNALTLFQSRNNATCKFHKDYNNYWKNRNEEENVRNLQKQPRCVFFHTREGLDEIASDVAGSIVATTKRLRPNLRQPLFSGYVCH
ncbi:hypothetical protein EDC94DRAFT_584745 [Helicostylum pulchrum]|nr:hypothetical protein EDC94DRAFT_584745 [Helicostylum pulchrum]